VAARHLDGPPRARISPGKGGRDLKLSTARAHPPIQIFIPQSPASRAVNGNARVYLHISHSCRCYRSRGGRWGRTERKPPILIFLPQSLQLHAPLTVTLTKLHGCRLRWRPTTRPQSSVQHVFPGYGGRSVRLTLVYTHRFLHLRPGLVHTPNLTSTAS